MDKNGKMIMTNKHKSIKECLLDIALDPNDDFGRVLKRCPAIRKTINGRKRKGKQKVAKP